MASTRLRGDPERRRRLSAAYTAMTIVERVLGKAHKVIDKALDQTEEVVLTNPDGTIMVDGDGLPVRKFIGGDTTTARWVIDKLIPKGTFSLKLLDGIELHTIADVIDAAEQIALKVIRGELTVAQGDASIEFLNKYCSLRAFEELAELRTLVAKAEAKADTAVAGAAAGTPLWGRLVEMQAVNKVPAE